jgi:hypothetical protein
VRVRVGVRCVGEKRDGAELVASVDFLRDGCGCGAAVIWGACCLAEAAAVVAMYCFWALRALPRPCST